MYVCMYLYVLAVMVLDVLPEVKAAFNAVGSR